MNTLLIAARKPMHVLVLAVAIVTGLIVHPWLLPLGLMTYLLAVVLTSRDDSLLTAAASHQQRKGLQSPTFLAKIKEIERSQEQVEQSLKRVGGAVAQRLAQSVIPQTRELLDRAYILARKGQDIEHYLTMVNPTQLQNQINEIDARIDRTTDQYTLDQLEGTRKALVEQRNSVQALQTYIGRITSQLENIDANLDTMPAQFMRMRASDVDASMASSQVAQHLSDLNADMGAFLTMLDTALDQTRSSGA